MNVLIAANSSAQILTELAFSCISSSHSATFINSNSAVPSLLSIHCIHEVDLCRVAESGAVSLSDAQQRICLFVAFTISLRSPSLHETYMLTLPMQLSGFIVICSAFEAVFQLCRFLDCDS